MKKVLLILCSIPFLINAQLRLDANNHLSLNHSAGQIGAGVFTISSSNNGWGGMYMNVTGNSARPFYGFAIDGVARSFTEYNESNSQLATFVDGIQALKIHKDSTSISNYLHVYNNANIGSSLTIGGDGEPFNQFTHFTINSRTGTFGGMYVNSIHSGANEKPFYGYAIDGLERAYTSFNNANNQWELHLADPVDGFDAIQVGMGYNALNGKVRINTMQDFNAFTQLTVRTEENTYGGMYIDVDNDGGDAKPFYGYAVNGVDRAYSYYDDSDNYWKLLVNSKDIIKASDTKFLVDGYVKLEVSNSTEVGSVYYKNGHFYGYTSTGEKQLDNNTALRNGDSTSEELESLKMEVQKLRAELNQLKELVKGLR